MAGTSPADAAVLMERAGHQDKLAAALLQSRDFEAAEQMYRRVLQTAEKLVSDHPDNPVYQRAKTYNLEQLANVNFQRGTVPEGLALLKQGLENSQRLTEANPQNLSNWSEVIRGRLFLGEAEKMMYRYEESLTHFLAAEAELKKLNDQEAAGELIAQWQPQVDMAISNTRELQQKYQIAAGDWDALISRSPEELAELLQLRIIEVSRRKQLDDTAQATAHLEKLAADADSNPENWNGVLPQYHAAAMLYSTACGYGQCAQLVKKSNSELTAEQQARFEKFQQQSLSCLKSAIAAGNRNFSHMQHDPDLVVLQELPEFKTLIPDAPPR